MLIQSGVPRSSCTTLSFQCTCRCDAITTHDDEWLKHPGRFGNPFDKKNHHTRLPPEEGIEKTTLSSLAWARLSLSCCRASLARPSPACSRRNKARTTRASQRQEALASLLYRIHQATLTKVGADGTTALERFVENSPHLEKNQKAVARQTLQAVAARAKQPGAVPRGALSSSPRKTKRRCGSQRPTGTPVLSLALRVRKQINPLSDRGRAASENRSPRKREHEEEEYGAWWQVSFRLLLW